MVLVASPEVVRAASYQVSTGDRLLDDALDGDGRRAVFHDLWELNRTSTRLARTDLGIDTADPWEGIDPVVDERITFRPSR